MSDSAPFVPEYAKPDAPGVHMGFDNTAGVYHVVAADDTFEQAAQGVFGLLREAQDRFPDWPRVLYIDIVGHEGDAGGFDVDEDDAPDHPAAGSGTSIQPATTGSKGSEPSPPSNAPSKSVVAP